MPPFEPIEIHFPQYGDYTIETLKKDLNLLVDEINERLAEYHVSTEQLLATIESLEARVTELES